MSENRRDGDENAFAPEKTPFMETGDPVGMKKRRSFNEDAANYDRWRPGYPDGVFEEIVRYSGIGPGKRALEIGIGTGQATGPILKTGCAVTAVELGEKLAAYSKEKFREFPNLKVQILPFEDYEEPDGSFDLIYSATAFHWIPEKIGFPKVYRLLKNGGTLALWWNRPLPAGPEELSREIQQVYDRYRPEIARKPEEDKTSVYRKIRETVLFHGFTEPEFRLFRAERTLNADGYVQLLNTYSDHRTASPEMKEAFESGIRQAILNHGGRITLSDSIDLYLARKPRV